LSPRLGVGTFGARSTANIQPNDPNEFNEYSDNLLDDRERQGVRFQSGKRAKMQVMGTIKSKQAGKASTRIDHNRQLEVEMVSRSPIKGGREVGRNIDVAYLNDKIMNLN